MVVLDKKILSSQVSFDEELKIKLNKIKASDFIQHINSQKTNYNPEYSNPELRILFRKMRITKRLLKGFTIPMVYSSESWDVKKQQYKKQMLMNSFISSEYNFKTRSYHFYSNSNIIESDSGISGKMVMEYDSLSNELALDREQFDKHLKISGFIKPIISLFLKGIDYKFNMDIFDNADNIISKYFKPYVFVGAMPLTKAVPWNLSRMLLIPALMPNNASKVNGDGDHFQDYIKTYFKYETQILEIKNRIHLIVDFYNTCHLAYSTLFPHRIVQLIPKDFRHPEIGKKDFQSIPHNKYEMILDTHNPKTLYSFKDVQKKDYHCKTCSWWQEAGEGSAKQG